jgi:hypothetical protein
VSQTTGLKNVEVTLRAILGIGGFHIVDGTPPTGCFNTEYFLTHGMDPLLAKVFPKRGKSHAIRPSVHLDNCRVHAPSAPKQFSDENSLVIVPHPPSRPDLAPCSF